MQAVAASNTLREKYLRFVRYGDDQVAQASGAQDAPAFRASYLTEALTRYAEAWAIADTAASFAPAAHYTRWTAARQASREKLDATRRLLNDMLALVTA